MSKPSTQVVAYWVKATVTVTDWRPLRDTCVEAVTSRWTGKGQAEVEDFVDEKLSHIAEHLREEAAQSRSDGADSRFEIDDESPPYIKAIDSYASKVLDRLRIIDPLEVERLCAKILTKLGANSQRTEGSADGGVDFTATNLNIVPGALRVPDACKALVIGQTKRYKDGNLISETRVREFIGAAVMRRHLLTREGNIGPLSPIIFAFWTTSDFEPNAKKFARESGLWFMDGFTFANYINELGLSGALL